MSKHTPGNWSYTPDPDGDGFEICVPGKLIAIVPHHSFRAIDHEEADARLITAAPEMLVEMKNIVHAYNNYLREETTQPAREQWSILIGRLESVVAKAECV